MFNKITITSALILSALSMQSRAAQDIPGWTFMTSTDDYNYYVKNGTLKEKQAARTMLIQQVPAVKGSNQSVEFRRFSIPIQACENEYGKITLSNLEGKVEAKLDYVKGGSSAAAYMADMACINIGQRL